jgi:choline monooxygenase
MRFEIDPDIRRASTLPAEFYRDPAVLARLVERVIAPGWHALGDLDGLAPLGQRALTLLPDCLDEPLLVTCDATGTLRCLSNVCTHRANLLVEGEATGASVRCRYHGRRFGLDGRMLAMPGFEGAADFPSERDHLPEVAWGRLGPLAFAALAPGIPFSTWMAPVLDRLGRLPLDRFRLDPASAHDYEVRAHFVLYLENYLEGLHIPFVHPELAGALDWGAYRTECFAHGILQLGIAADQAPAFAPGTAAVENGARVAAYYYWLFPSTMLNFYPWGLSLNVVTPLSIDRTRVSFRSYVLDEDRRGAGAGGDLDLVERQDDAIVERVQRGVRARLYRKGRYSPAHEIGVHHLHRLLVAALD